MNSTASADGNRRRNEAAKAIQINDSVAPSFSDLPNNILVTILLKLPVKRIFVCKCVCKPWTVFAKLHFNQAQVYPLLRISGYTCPSRMLYLVQLDQDDFERNFEMCYDPNSPIKIELDSKLKLPMRNIQKILDQEGIESKEYYLNLNMENHKYSIVNSCNGLLCLSDPSDHNEPVKVCNPVTKDDDHDDGFFGCWTYCGFGFSPVTGQYKVIRMFRRRNKVIVAEIYILGTETWRVLPSLPASTDVKFPTYLNGCVYLFSINDDDQRSVICFDIEKECFESISLPPLTSNVYRLSMGVLGGELFISDFQIRDILRFWVMKDNGASKSWSQIYSFKVDNDEKWPTGSYQPIKYTSNGELLMFNSCERALICKDPRKTGFRYLKLNIHGCYYNSQVEAIAHIPSFVRLKHALSGGGLDATVFNINSRCAGLKLYGEGQGISIIEEDINSYNVSEELEYDFYEDIIHYVDYDFEY